MKKSLLFIVVAVLLALPLIYLAAVYPRLPQTIPVHFGLDGRPNAFGGKSELVGAVAALTVLSAAVFLIVRYLPKIDPKVRNRPNPGDYTKIAFAVTALLSALIIMIIYGTRNGELSINKMLGPLLGIFFSVLGNLMYNIKPNYFVGIKVPWTLESEENWRATHHVGGKLWFVGGLVVAAGCLLLPPGLAQGFFVGGLLTLGIIPIVYSYRYYRMHGAGLKD